MALAVAITVARGWAPKQTAPWESHTRKSLNCVRLRPTMRIATRRTRAASWAAQRYCSGTRATGRATPRFLARLDRRLVAPAPWGAPPPPPPGWCLVMGTSMSQAQSRLVSLLGHHAGECRAALGCRQGSARCAARSAAAALTAHERSPDRHLRDGRRDDRGTIQARSEPRLGSDDRLITSCTHDRISRSTKQREDDGMNDERIRNMKTARGEQ
jgi:hypothetical protein